GGHGGRGRRDRAGPDRSRAIPRPRRRIRGYPGSQRPCGNEQGRLYQDRAAVVGRAGHLIRERLIGARCDRGEELQSSWVNSAAREEERMSREPDEALEVLRGVWSAQGQTSADLDEAGTGKSCKRMADVGFGELDNGDTDVRAAWRARLEREGKLGPDGDSVADLVLRPAERG